MTVYRGTCSRGHVITMDVDSPYNAVHALCGTCENDDMTAIILDPYPTHTALPQAVELRRVATP